MGGPTENPGDAPCGGGTLPGFHPGDDRGAGLGGRARYLAIGAGDTELYIFAGMLAAVVISLRVFLFRGAGRAN